MSQGQPVWTNARGHLKSPIRPWGKSPRITADISCQSSVMGAPSQKLGWEPWYSISHISEYVTEIHTHVEVSPRWHTEADSQSTMRLQLVAERELVTGALMWLLFPQPLGFTPSRFYLMIASFSPWPTITSSSQPVSMSRTMTTGGRQLRNVLPVTVLLRRVWKRGGEGMGSEVGIRSPLIITVPEAVQIERWHEETFFPPWGRLGLG